MNIAMATKSAGLLLAAAWIGTASAAPRTIILDTAQTYFRHVLSDGTAMGGFISAAH